MLAQNNPSGSRNLKANLSEHLSHPYALGILTFILGSVVHTSRIESFSSECK
jgi:hypothetical protein